MFIITDFWRLSIPKSRIFLQDRKGESVFSLSPCVSFVQMLFHAAEGLGTDVVLDLAGILRRHLRRHAHVDEPLGEPAVPLVDLLGHLLPGGGQLQPPVLLHNNVAAGL